MYIIKNDSTFLKYDNGRNHSALLLLLLKDYEKRRGCNTYLIFLTVLITNKMNISL